MKPLPLEEIRTAIHGRWIARGAAAVIDAVTTDTRTARPGELFVAIRGERFDGHTFLSQAADAGCAGAIVRLDGEPRPEVTSRFSGGVITVPETTAALGNLARYHRSLVPATVVAVTGSNGKTTVKRMIHRILSGRLSGSCSPKSFNNAIGLPLTLLDVSGGDDYVVCEIGSSRPGEVAALGGIARPDIAVITSVGETHLEGLGDLALVAAEKASILQRLSADGLAVVWADSELLDKAVLAYDRRVVRFGESDSADLRLTAYEVCDRRRRRAQLNDRVWIDLGVPGKHNAVNALAAIAVAQRMGFSREEAALALSGFEGVEMRLEWIDCGEVTVLNDAYNANPSSVLAGAEVLSETEGDRRIVIAGDMHELGEEAEMLHVRTGRQIAERGVDLLIAVGPLGRYIAKGAADAGAAVEAFDSVDAADRELAALLRGGDVVLIKGSRAMGLERLVESVRAAFGTTADSAAERERT